MGKIANSNKTKSLVCEKKISLQAGIISDIELDATSIFSIYIDGE